jgi:hypothetical protein
MFRKVLPIAVAAAAPLFVIGGGAHAQKASDTTHTCQFTSGARAGSTVDFSQTHGVAAARVGSHCGDMMGSNGVAVAPEALREPGVGRYHGPVGRYYRTPGAPVGMNKAGRPSAGWTRWCHFTRGPSAGSSSNFAGVLGATPIQIGTACSDGANTGVGVAGAS